MGNSAGRRISSEGTTDLPIPSNIPIIGFTGALGSGCSFMAKAVAHAYDYKYYELSAPIHKAAKRTRRRRKEFARNLQNVGNELRRKYGPSYLAGEAMKLASAECASGTRGIVLDGFRNSREVVALNTLPSFYLISIHASRNVRQDRLLQDRRVVENEKDFEEADRRDRQERLSYGQQVSLCNELADIIILNDDHVAIVDAREHSRTKLDKYVSIIEGLSKGKRPDEAQPSLDEVLMTMTYCASRGSSCLKRKVGALIAATTGEVLSTGHNDTPEGAESCLRHEELGCCARDKIQEIIGKDLLYCPHCGKKIRANLFQCRECGKKLQHYSKLCPNCRNNPDISYKCSCGISVFEQYLPGAHPRTGKLLDMCRAVHAEQNAILNLTRAGRPMPTDAVLYTTTYPCNLCANLIVNAGVTKLVYAEPYVTLDAAKVLRGKVKAQPFEGVKSSAFFRFYT